MRGGEATTVLNEISALDKEIEKLRVRRKQLYADIENLPKEKQGLIEELKFLSEQRAEQKREIELYISKQKEAGIKKQLETDIEILQAKLGKLEREYSALLLKKNKL